MANDKEENPLIKKNPENQGIWQRFRRSSGSESTRFHPSNYIFNFASLLLVGLAIGFGATNAIKATSDASLGFSSFYIALFTTVTTMTTLFIGKLQHDKPALKNLWRFSLTFVLLGVIAACGAAPQLFVKENQDGQTEGLNGEEKAKIGGIIFAGYGINLSVATGGAKGVDTIVANPTAYYTNGLFSLLSTFAWMKSPSTQDQNEVLPASPAVIQPNTVVDQPKTDEKTEIIIQKI